MNVAGRQGGAQVRIEPIGITIQSRPGEPLMRAALRQGLKWPTICGGAGLCGECYVRVVAASGDLPPIGKKEQKALLNVLFPDPETRLACQIVLSGDLVVERDGVVRA